MSQNDRIRTKVINYIHEEIGKGATVMDLFKRFSDTTLPGRLSQIDPKYEKTGFRYAQLELSGLMQHPERQIRKNGQRPINDADMDKHLFGY